MQLKIGLDQVMVLLVGIHPMCLLVTKVNLTVCMQCAQSVS